MCAKYVLNKYSKDENINVLAYYCRDTATTGCTLQAIQSMLSDKGVECFPCDIHDLWSIRFSHPAILFIPKENTKSGKIGHFVVIDQKFDDGALSIWLPSIEDNEYVPEVIANMHEATLIFTKSLPSIDKVSSRLSVSSLLVVLFSCQCALLAQNVIKKGK